DSGTPGTSVVTAATLATSAGVVDLAAHKLGLPAATVGAAVQAQPVTQSDIVSVTAQQESSAPRAADIANALAAAVVKERRTLYANSVARLTAALRSREKALAVLPGKTAETAAIQQRLADLDSLPASDPSIR